MTLAGRIGHEVGWPSPVATAKPLVFAVDGDFWMRESLETRKPANLD
jgi:hypothetical protein